MFERASRLKLRFDTPKGSLTVEDLWDLPLTATGKVNLNDLAKGLKRELDDLTVENFVNVGPTPIKDRVQLKFDITLHVIKTKQEEQVAASTAADRKAQKEKLLAILARKQESELEGKSPDELRKMIEAL